MNKVLIILFLSLSSCNWKTESPLSKVGKHEKTTIFTFFPFECSNGKTYWLETIKIDRTWDISGAIFDVMEYDTGLEK